jgi:hypothetical protein
MPPAAPAEKNYTDETKPDFREYIFGLSPDQWKNHIIYLTRELPKTSINGLGGYLTKLQQPFDFEDIKQAYGGYEFSYILKEGNDICKKCRNATGRFKVEAPPKFDTTREAPSAAPSNGHSASDAGLLQQFVGVLRDELARSRESNSGANPATDKAIELLASASEKAMDIVKNQVPQSKGSSSEMREMIGMLREMGLLGAPVQSKSLLEQLGELLSSPLIAPLIAKFFTPADPLTELGKLGSAMDILEKIRGTSSSGGRSDWKEALVSEGIPAVKELIGTIAENRKAAVELAQAARDRAQANARAAQSVETINSQRASIGQRPANAPAPAGQPAAIPPAPPATAGPFRVVPINGVDAAPETAAAVPETTANADEYLKGVKIRFVELLAAGEDSGFIVDFLDAARPDLVEMILKYTPAQITGFFKMDPIVKHAVENPRWGQFLQESRAYLEENGELEPANTLKN